MFTRDILQAINETVEEKNFPTFEASALLAMVEQLVQLNTFIHRIQQDLNLLVRKQHDNNDPK